MPSMLLSCLPVQKGFSLLELLVVLVIVGFMAVLIPPRLSGIMATTQAKSAAREIVSALRQSRNLAISSQKDQVFIIDLAKKIYSIDPAKAKKLPDKVKINLYTARSEQISEQVGGIRFFPDGSSTGGRINLTLRNQDFFIDIKWLTGKVALLDNIDLKDWKSDNDAFATINQVTQ